MATTFKIHSFGLGEKTTETSKDVLGGKGAGLVYMSNLGVSVPPGFIIPCSTCSAYFKSPDAVMETISKSIEPYLAKLKAKFGYMPLLSVRSGSRQSMPGMMDTILNVGLDENTMDEWVVRLGINCVSDSRRRLIEMYGSVVQGIDRSKFHGQNAGDAAKTYKDETGSKFPMGKVQLLRSIEAVFRSWNNERAKFYRKQHGIPESWGTAVTVMAMVFGNMNDQSGTGVLFTRNPDSGQNVVTGEFLPNAQGEDVVAGIRTPLPLSKMFDWNKAVHAELQALVLKLEKDKKDVQDVEFTVQDGKLFVLQTRTAKRSAGASVKTAMDMLQEKLIDADEVTRRVSFREFRIASAPVVDPAYKVAPASTGLPACSGVATGVVVHTAKDAVASKVPCVLVTNETTPDDIAGMDAAAGVLTMTGGATSHAAVVARAMNKACVVGLGKKQADFPVGSVVSIDGATGRVWAHEVPVVNGAGSPELKQFKELVKSKVSTKVVYDGEGFVDASRMAPAEALAAVNDALDSNPGKVVLNLKASGGEAEAVFAKMFGTPNREALVLAALSDLTLTQKNRLVFVCEGELPEGVHSIARVTSLKELVAAKGEVLLDFTPDEWEKKVVAWKQEKEPVVAVSIGGVVVGTVSYVNELEVVAEVLAAAQKGI